MYVYVTDTSLWRTVEKLYHCSLKDNTKKTYSSAQRQYLSFCESKGLKPLPTNEEVLLLFIAFLHEKKLKGQSIKVYLSAVRQLHINFGFSFIDFSPKIKLVLKGSMVLSGPVNRKSPITYELLSQIIETLKFREDRIMLTAAMSLAFFGCLRAGEICVSDNTRFNSKTNLCLNDLKFIDDNKYAALGTDQNLSR